MRLTDTVLPSKSHLPPHLGEICIILASGLVPLYGRKSSKCAVLTPQAGNSGDCSLHFDGGESVYAERRFGDEL